MEKEVKVSKRIIDFHISRLANEEIRDNDYYQYLKILEDWQDFSDCLSKEDESVFVDMITNCYINYHSSINSCHDKEDGNKNENNKFDKSKESKSCLNRINSLFMALFLYQQKQLNLIKSDQIFIDSFH